MRRKILWITVLVAVLFTLLDPEATKGLHLLPRLLQWLIQVAIGLTILVGIQLACQRTGVCRRLPGWLAILFTGCLGALLFTPFAIGIDLAVGLDTVEVDGPGDLARFFIEEAAPVIGPMLVVWIAINTPVFLAPFQAGPEPRDTAGTAPEAPAPVAMPVGEPGPDSPDSMPSPALFRLLPARIGRDIVYMKSELHYLLVVTTTGESLILFTLKEAMAEVGTLVPGMQTHRSFWVAAHHARDLVRKRGTLYVLTTNDHLVPISRRKSAEAKQFFQTPLAR